MLISPEATPATAPAAPVPTRSAPSSLTVPSLKDGSATAAAALNQVGSYLGLLSGGLATSGGFEALIGRGFLTSAQNYATYAQQVLKYDQVSDNDALGDMIGGAITDALVAVDRLNPESDFPALVAELSAAHDAATNIAHSLDIIAARETA